jgi:RNA-directed DNA polymerase
MLNEHRAMLPHVQTAWAWLYSARMKLAHLSVRAPLRPIGDLFNLVCSVATLTVATWLVAENDGADTAGVDGVIASHVVGSLFSPRSFILGLQASLKSGLYRPSPLRVCWIPKGDGGRRQLAIPTFVDRVVQMAMKLVLEPVLEPRFSPWSFGFRPHIGCHHAIAEVRRILVTAPITHVFKLDIQSFFDTVDHGVLLRLLERHVRDRRVMRLTERFLSAEPLMGRGELARRNRGTPQGGVISPLLSNVYLHELDTLYLGVKNNFSISPGFGPDDDGLAVRYADDVVIMKPGGAEELLAVRNKVRAFLGDHLKLRCSPLKSSVRSLEEGVSFLGFNIRREGADIEIEVAKKSAERMQSRLETLIRDAKGGDSAALRSQIDDTFNGWTEYFRVASNMTRIEDVAEHARWMYRQWVGQRQG